MTEGVYQALLTDLMLAAALLALFLYVARLSRGVRGVALWGAMHFAYTFGTTLLDAISHALETLVSTRQTALSDCFSRSAWRLINSAMVM